MDGLNDSLARGHVWVVQSTDGTEPYYSARTAAVHRHGTSETTTVSFGSKKRAASQATELQTRFADLDRGCAAEASERTPRSDQR